MGKVLIHIRSIIFNGFFLFWTSLWAIIGTLCSILPRRFLIIPEIIWSRGVQFFLPLLVGIKVSIINKNKVPDGPCIIACKHQSVWETTIFHGTLPDPAVVLKSELLDIPFFGIYTQKLEMIPIDREAGTASMRKMLKAAKIAVKKNRPIVIFPEGTRVSNEGEADIKAGIYGLYSLLKIPVVPVALNSGKYWPITSYLRFPGTIKMEYLDAIEPGLGKEIFMEKLKKVIDKGTRRLMIEN